MKGPREQMAAEHDLASTDSLLSIEITPMLPCGIGACGEPARRARVERDIHFASLWRLLPICDAHLRSLQAAAGHISAEAPPDPVALGSPFSD